MFDLSRKRHGAAPTQLPSAGRQRRNPAASQPRAIRALLADGHARSSPPLSSDVRSDTACEREADRVAERVTGESANRSGSAPAPGIAPPASVQIASGEGGSRAREDQAAAIVPSLASAQLRQDMGAGRVLPERPRRQLERGFGQDFSRVRIHTDAGAEAAAQALSARAFTVGRDIAFNRGEYDPQSLRGQRLLAHELTHVLQQQRSGRVSLQREAMPASATAEATNADRRMFIEETIRSWESAVEWLGMESTSMDAARFERMIDSWYLMVNDREGMIDRYLDGDSVLRRSLRSAYTAAIRALIGKYAAADSSPDESTLYRLNRGRIPMWAWQTPHHTEDFITTPVPQGVHADVLSGDVETTINGIRVRFLPDTVDSALAGGAETRINFTLGRIDYESSGGRITSFTGPPTPLASIQTARASGVSLSGSSGYGRGTTTEDAAGARVTGASGSLSFHEASHGLDFQEYMRGHAPPAFDGRVGMRVAEFNARITAWRSDWSDYNRDINRFSTLQTDCVGTTIDQYNQANAAAGATVVLECGQP
ncbi:MAG: DUF4157 domain-containing protein [Gammaproteobacteria bacterium]|nr:DUF4157 domain-containing protein [Gammaproteobacteria bacterium]